MVKCCAVKYTARDLREVVEFQRENSDTDVYNSRIGDGWAAITGAPTRAMVRPMSGSERWQNQRVEATANYRVVTRYSDLINEGDRVMIRGRPGDIKFVANVGMMDEWLEIDVALGVAT